MSACLFISQSVCIYLPLSVFWLSVFWYVKMMNVIIMKSVSNPICAWTFFFAYHHICVQHYMISTPHTFNSYFSCSVQLDGVLSDEADIVSTVNFQNRIDEKTAIGNTCLIFRKYQSWGVYRLLNWFTIWKESLNYSLSITVKTFKGKKIICLTKMLVSQKIH